MSIESLKNPFLLVSVFVTGAAVLIVEIVATRILSPYYGNTIYTTSSVIGTVLAALSLGYFLGGRAADKFPHHKVFYGIIVLSGVIVVLIQVLQALLLGFLSSAFSIISGPLISSLIIFFVPAFLLGTLSPFAIKLHQAGQEHVGRQAGEIFFWSTLGSIAGSFLSGFWLIPFFGINAIIFCTGMTVAVWGLVGLFLFSDLNKKVLVVLLVAVFTTGFLTAPFFFTQRPLEVLYEKDGVYEKIRISEGEWQGRPTRFLFQDRSYSAAMYLDSNELAYDYTKYYELYKLFKKDATHAFVIGGGAYSIPKALLNDSLAMQVDVAEIEPSLYNLSKQYFHLEDSERLHNYQEDGRRFLSKTDNIYDVIVGDAYYSLFSIPIHITTKEFFSLVKSRLSENGVFVANFSGDLTQDSPSLIFSEMRTFTGVFDSSYFFAVKSPNEKKPQNIIFVGVNGDNKINFGGPEITKSNNPIFKTLAEKQITFDKSSLVKYKEITDNFAPIEYLVSKVIKVWN